MSVPRLELIDVWDTSTFDPELADLLAVDGDLIRNYMDTERNIFLSHDLGRGARRSNLRPNNPYQARFLALTENIGEHMQRRTVRAWHYTRLTDTEVVAMRRDGIHLSTLKSLSARLDAQVAAGELAQGTADALYKASPLHSDQRNARSAKFWMTSHPIAIDSSGVEPLMAHWGGEVVYMWVENPALLAPLAVIGSPRVIELAVPLDCTSRTFSAAEAVVATFGRTLGCTQSNHAFDLYVTKPLSGERVIEVHSHGDASFRAMADGYPNGYVDADRNCWRELTGEDE